MYVNFFFITRNKTQKKVADRQPFLFSSILLFFYCLLRLACVIVIVWICNISRTSGYLT